jgi:isoquinoline 1-oxidoreductase beta subunit
MTKIEISRRQFLVTTAAVGGGLALGFYLPAPAEAAVMASNEPWYGATVPPGAEVNAWIVIAPDNTVTIRVGQSEMGQGVFTSMPMIVAEELECDWSMVRAEYASANRSIREGNVYQRMGTGGSGAVRQSRPFLQAAGASARERLKEAAAQMWGVPRADLTTAAGVVTHAASGRSATYGELAAAAATVTLAEEPAVKEPGQFSLLGTPLPRLDTPLKVTGAAVYGIDVKVPGMVYAATRTSPVTGGKVVSFNADSIRGLPGVIDVVEIGKASDFEALQAPQAGLSRAGFRSGVAVVADTWWHARSALDQLAIEWDLGEGATLNSDELMERDLAALDRAESGAVATPEVGDTLGTIAAASNVIEAVYTAPYQAHATMEPMNATAQVTADRVDVWTGTQNPPNALAQAAEAAGVAPENVHIHTCFLGGGFGGRIRPEVRQAVEVSKAIGGTPVKVLWSREDDMESDWYDPRAAIKFRASIGPDGLPTALYMRMVGDSIQGWTRPDLLMAADNANGTGVDGTVTQGLRTLPYLIPNRRLEFIMSQTHTPVYFWRAPGHNHNIFFLEGFIDELAEAAGQDTVEYRRQLLRDLPEWLNVLNVCVENSNWGQDTYPGFGRGVAVGEAFGSIVAAIAEVSVSRRGQMTMERIDVAIDCGNAVNPRTIAEQTESSLVYGLSAALLGEITFRNGSIQQRNFDSYPVMRMADTPVMNTHLALRGGNVWGGIGEVALPAGVAAVMNAVAAATGKRVRSLPLRRTDLSW